MKEKQFLFNDVIVKYKLKKAKSDRKHLLVIFSGFGVNYDFFNLSRLFRFNVLWIKDEYQGTDCYCIGKEGGFQFCEAVNQLICNILSENNLTKEQCTLLGSSKGGFVSLFIGLKYDYKNIISSVFTSLLGSRMKELRPHIGRFVMGENFSDEDVFRYDNLLLNTIKEDNYLDRNIYVFLSEADDCYEDNQKPLLLLFGKYKNFNIVKTNSKMVFRHNTVTSYNVPLITSFVNSLGEGLAPSFDYFENGAGDALIESFNEKSITDLEQVTNFSKCEMIQDTLYIEGDSFFRGLPCETYGLYKKKLILFNDDKKYIYKLGTVLDKLKGNQYFENNYIDYSAAGFATVHLKGIDLSEMAEGVYDIAIELEYRDKHKGTQVLRSEKNIERKYWNQGEYEYRIWSHDGAIKISKRSLLLPSTHIPHINLSLVKIIDNKLYIEGIYAVTGIEIRDWDDVQYYLIIHNEANKYFYTLGKLHVDSLNSLVDYGYGVYQKSAFATQGKKGIDLLDIKNDGTYSLSILLSYKGSIFSEKLEEKIVCYKKELILNR